MMLLYLWQVTNFLKSKKNSKITMSRGNFKDKARLRIGELETERLRLQGERQQLMERVSLMTSEHVAKDVAKKTENAEFLKKISEYLYSKLQRVTEMLLESTSLLGDVVKCVNQLSKTADSELIADNKNRSTDMTRTPLNIICDDILNQMSHDTDAALSITTMTPSSSSSDNEEAISSAMSDHLTPDTSLSLDVWSSSQDFMDVDFPAKNPARGSPLLSSTPNSSPTGSFIADICKLATTPEVCEESPDSPKFAPINHSLDSPCVSLAVLPAEQRRYSKRRSVKENFFGYKEPPLNSKLRQGDPYTDCSLYSPQSFQLNKRKNKQREDNPRKRIKNEGGRKRSIELCMQ